MPNHIKNKVELFGKRGEIDKLKSHMIGYPWGDEIKEENKSLFDFNKIISMPSTLHVESSSFGEYGQHILFGESDISWLGDDEIKRRYNNLEFKNRLECDWLGKMYQRNQMLFGHPTWYGWACENWRTKWNAYSIDGWNNNTITFETAWSCVVHLIVELSRKHPSINIKYSWASEDTGYNCGDAKIQNGILYWYSEPRKSGGRRGHNIALRLWPEEKDRYHLINGNFEYKDEE